MNSSNKPSPPIISIYERVDGPLGVYVTGDVTAGQPENVSYRTRDGKQKIVKLLKFEVLLEIDNPHAEEKAVSRHDQPGS